MTKPVPRTCTEITQNEPDHRGERKSRPPKEFRSKPAYVLLGDPGAGKSTAFKVESGEVGEEAVLISARDFITFSVSSHPEWRGKTLFIDGLDEVRAGSPDARTPFDAIRSRLDELGKPIFRISCREADWLGENDRTNLAKVSRDSKVTALRLDPLAESDIELILNTHPGIDDVRSFVSKARDLGIAELLANPQTLTMLADVVGRNKGWPASRLETFDRACRQMAEERNQGHAYATDPPVIDQLLDAAGRLCAIQLISGAAGFSRRANEPDADCPALDECDYDSPEVLRQALSTRLFEGDGEGRFVPVHRHIAEFLGARHLARLISEGLPVRRVISLIAGEDGVVVTEFRGLSAWLAAHCRKARADLIQSDPIGVGLYGDIREFRPDEKRKLILSLNREVTRLDYRTRFAPAFAPLASPEMESTLRDVLTESGRDRDHQLVVEFLLSVLRGGTPLPSLSQILLDIVRDDTRWPRVTPTALDAFIHNSADSPDRTSKLRRLLADIRTGRVSDPGNELLGTLLAHLYPQEVGPAEVWKYFNQKGDPYLIGRYLRFWEEGLVNRSSDDKVAELLDHLHQRLPGLRSAFESRLLDHLPMKLLARGLNARGDELETGRLYNWLNAGAFRDWDGPSRTPDSVEPILQVRRWLEQRPDVQKSVLVEGLIRCPDSARFWLCSSTVWNSLHGCALPPDFGLWSLERAVELVEAYPRVSRYLLQHAVHSFKQRTNDQELSRSVLVERTSGHQILERQLEDLLDPPIDPADLEWRRTVEKHEEDKRRQDQWIEYVRSNADDLLENRATSDLLNGIARAYYGGFPRRPRNATADQRLGDLLGNDDDLTEAALAGLRGTIWRDDVPEVGKIISLRAERKIHHLALPFLAGLEDTEHRRPDLLARLDENQKRKALAFLYCMPGNRDGQWYLDWLDSDPKLVAEVLFKCAAPAMRSGDESVPSLYELDRLAHANIHAQIVQSVTLPLLRAFPLRSRLKQIQALDILLWAAIRHLDEPFLRQLVEKKLSRRSMNVGQRIHWLAAGALLAPAKYLTPLEEFVGGNEARIRQLAAFLCSGDRLPSLPDDLPVASLTLFVGLLGRSFGPHPSDGRVVRTIQGTRQVELMIQQLTYRPGRDATQALKDLSVDPELRLWRDMLDRSLDFQRVIHRDAAYRHPSLEQICRTLGNQSPANPSDLAALVMDRLCDLAIEIRTVNTDPWRQYWNEDAHGRPATPKHEDSCRDALLSDLRARLPDGVDAQPEGQYAGHKRADIRVSFEDFNVPVEVKRSRHPDLWSAARNQLIAKYTSDPATGGYGIYLVFWFGENDCQPPPSGARPSTAEELRRRLQVTLTDDEARKISICVVDVSPAGKV